MEGRTDRTEKAVNVVAARTEKPERTLEAMRAEYADLRRLLLTETIDNALLSERLAKLEKELANASLRWKIRLASLRLREAGNRLTGGGVRALAKRILSAFLRRAARHTGLIALGRALLKPYPSLANKLQELATSPDPDSSGPGRLPAESLPSENSAGALPLSASARSIYLKLQAARSDSSARNRGR